MIDFCNYKWTTEMEGGRIIHPAQPWMWYDACAVDVVDNNTIELTAYREPIEVKYWDGRVFYPSVACGLIRSKELFGYGRFSSEIQLPKGRNLWPSFWLVGEGEPWPKCGEIDIMESWTPYFCATIPQPPYLVPSWDTTTNIHWQEDDGSHGYAGSRRLPLCVSAKNPSKHYIKYEVEWRPNIITFYANGKRVRCYGWDVAQHLLDKKMRVVFNIWTTQDQSTSKQFSCDTPMKIRSFEYKPIEVL